MFKTPGDSIPAQKEMPRRSLRNRTAATEAEEPTVANEMAADLFDQLSAKGSALKLAIDQINSNPPLTALNALLNLLLLAAGLPGTVEISVEDDAARCLAGWQESWAQRGQLEYPLAQKVGAKRQNPLQKGFAEWWERLAQESGVGGGKKGGKREFDRVAEQELSSMLIDWLIVLSGSGYRPLRHVATLACLHWMTGLGKRCVQLAKELDRLTKLQAERKGEEVALQSAEAEQQVQSLFEAVFVQRFRDCCPQIRQACLCSLTKWIEVWPEVFLDNGYLRYLGWALSDRQGGVRLEAIRSWQQIYSHQEWFTQLSSLLDRFRDRLLQMASRDAEQAVRKAGLQLIGELVSADVLEVDDEFVQDAEPSLIPKTIWSHLLFAGQEPSVNDVGRYLDQLDDAERASQVASAILAAFPQLHALESSHPVIIEAALKAKPMSDPIGVSRQLATLLVNSPPSAAWWGVAQLLDWEVILHEVGEPVIMLHIQRLLLTCLQPTITDKDLPALVRWLKRLASLAPLQSSVEACIGDCLQGCLENPLAEQGRAVAYLLGLVRIPLPLDRQWPLPEWRRVLLQELAWSILEQRCENPPDHERILHLRDTILDSHEPGLESLAISIDCITLVKRPDLPSLWSSSIQLECHALPSLPVDQRVRAICALNKLILLGIPCEPMLKDCLNWLRDNQPAGIDAHLRVTWQLAEQHLNAEQLVHLFVQLSSPALLKWMLQTVKTRIEQYGPLLPQIFQAKDPTIAEPFVSLLTPSQTKELLNLKSLLPIQLTRSLSKHALKVDKGTVRTSVKERRPSRLRQVTEQPGEEEEEESKVSQSELQGDKENVQMQDSEGEKSRMMMTSEGMSAPSSPLRMIRKRIVRM